MADITLITRSGKNAELTWNEMDNNLSIIAQAINNKQDLQAGLTDLISLTGTYGFLKKNGTSWTLDTNSYLLAGSLDNYVNKTATEEIGGYKTFTNHLRVPSLKSVTESNGGSFIDINDGQISIGTGLNSANGTPEISIENHGYGMSVIFKPSDSCIFDCGTTFNQGATFNQDVSFNNIYSSYMQTGTLVIGSTDILDLIDANNYVHPTTDGNLHVPATGTTNNGKALVAGSTAGSLSWTALAISHITGLQTALDAKQATLVSGTNIKTVNGTSILGSGNITIAAGGIQKARFTATEGQTTFLCTGITLNDPLVYLNGILQDQGDVYTYSGSTVTFVNPRYLNERIVVVQ